MIVFPEIFYRGTSFLNSHHWTPAQKRCGTDRMGDYRVFTSVRFNWLKIVANLVGSYMNYRDDVVSYAAPLARLLMGGKVGDCKVGTIAGKERHFAIISIGCNR